jgi:hypothetical protein
LNRTTYWQPAVYHITKHTQETTETIPKIIWTFWDDQSTIPSFIQHCFDSWKRMNPTYKVIIISNSNWKDYIYSEPPKYLNIFSSARKSDWIRLSLLYEHGGIWIDASTILTQKIDWVQILQQQDKSEGVLFSLRKWERFDHVPNEYHGGNTGELTFMKHSAIDYPKLPVIESWFISCVKNANFIHAWLREFEYALHMQGILTELFGYHDYLVEKYGSNRFHDEIKQYIFPSMVNYLTIHLAAQKVMQVDKVPHGSSILFAEHGPLWIQDIFESDTKKFAEIMLANPSQDETFKNASFGPFIKLRSGERNLMLEQLSNPATQVDPNSYYMRFVINK